MTQRPLSNDHLALEDNIHDTIGRVAIRLIDLFWCSLKVHRYNIIPLKRSATLEMLRVSFVRNK